MKACPQKYRYSNNNTTKTKYNLCASDSKTKNCLANYNKRWTNIPKRFFITQKHSNKEMH